MRLLVLPGDGIGPEITAATLAVLRKSAERYGFPSKSRKKSSAMPACSATAQPCGPELLELARAADGLILGPAATFDFQRSGKRRDQPLGFLPQNSRPLRQYPPRAHLSVVCRKSSGPSTS